MEKQANEMERLKEEEEYRRNGVESRDCNCCLTGTGIRVTVTRGNHELLPKSTESGLQGTYTTFYVHNAMRLQFHHLHTMA